MKAHTLRRAGVAVFSVNLLTFVTIAYALTSQPTTLTGLLAVRIPVSGCHTGAMVTSTRTLKVTFRSNQQRQIGVQVEGGQETSASAHQGLGDPPMSITARPVAVVDNSAMLHRSVDPYRFGMVVARVNVPC